MRISAATSQPSSSGDTCARIARSTIASETPLSIRIRPNPPPAPTTSVTSAMGPRLSFVNCEDLLPVEAARGAERVEADEQRDQQRDDGVARESQQIVRAATLAA